MTTVSVILLLPSVASAQTSATPEEQYKKLIKINEDIQPLGDTPFGERISLSDGSLSFSQVDVSVPGTGPTISVGRDFAMHSVGDRPDLQDRAFGDWDIELPQIFTVTAQQRNVPGWRVDAADPTRICHNFNAPPSVAKPPSDAKRADWEPETWWQGYQLRIPGEGSQDLLYRSAANTFTAGVMGLSYPIVTRSNWTVGCLDHASNDATIEGFLAISPDGTKYWLDHIAYRYMPSMTRPLGSSPVSLVASSNSMVHPQATNEDILIRREGRMLVTRIEDRFGRAITYTYNGDLVTNIDSVRKTPDDASDDRHVTIAYEAGTPRISTVTVQGGAAGSRTWTYNYVKSVPNLVYTLTSVTQPDGSSWGYNLDPFNGAWVDSRESGGSCDAIGVPTNLSSTFTASLTHPSGLTASYTVAPLKRGRSYVPRTCSSVPNQPAIPTLSGTWAQIPNASYDMAITQRVLTGAGLDAAGLTWHYGYSAANESWFDNCSAGCPTTISTDVTYPDGHLERSTFSNHYDWTESQLVSEDVFDGGATTAVRQTTHYLYVEPVAQHDARAAAYAHPWGTVTQQRVNKMQLQEQSPMATRQVIMDPANASPDTYTWNASAFDAFARATDVQRSSSIGYGVSERSTFTDDAAHWVIGLPVQLDNLTNAETVSHNDYDPTMLTLSARYRFGRKVMDYTFNTDGQLESYTDARNNKTTLTGYKRGIPQTIAFPDGTSQSIAVDDFGQISAITNQNAATTAYSYDAIGRLARIDYPANDTPALAPKTFAYTFIADARGLGGSHWMRLASQGNWSQRTDYDVLLRPIMFGKAEAATGLLYVSSRTEYDWKGRKTFESYPVDGELDRSAITLGTSTAYDALGRTIRSTQSSELGDLITSSQYPAGAAQVVVDPKGNSTTSHYQVFDQPSFDKVIRVDAPEGVSQAITRDVYGNPQKIVQGPVIKTLIYDSEKRLCRTQEPESDSQIVAYDNTDNIAWSASVNPYKGDIAGCGYDQVPAAAQITRAYDAMNRLTSQSYPSGTLATSFTYDALGNPATAVSATATSSANNTGSVGWTYGRNKLGLLTAEVLAVDGWSWSLGYGYDSNGVLSTIQYPDGEMVAYNPSALGQPTTAGSYASGVTYFPDGGVRSYTLGSGALYSTEKNARNLLANFTYGTPATLAVSEDYTYDPGGNITAITDRLGSNQRTKAMSYDGLNRLTAATASNLWGTESYTYDTVNNISTLTNSGGTNTYNYDGRNLLTSISNSGAMAHAFQYDGRGNTVAKDSQAMTFDLANRLLSIPGKGEYMYDAAGRRVKNVTASGTTYYAYNSAGQLMWQYDPASTNGTNYIHLGKTLVANKKASTSVVTGSIEGVNAGTNASIVGWACATGLAAPIDVHLYVGGPAGTGADLGPFTANQTSEDSIQVACHSTGTLHRFVIPLTEANRVQYAGKAIYIDGISPVGGDNLALAGSGTFLVPPSILAPVSPASVSGAAAGDLSSISVNWSATPNTTSYTVQQSINDAAWTTVYTGNATSTVIANPGDANYRYQVQACNANGCSNPTISNTVTIAHIPPTPGGINVPATSIGAVAISWPASAYATSYSVEHTQDGNWTQVYAGAATTTTINESAFGNWYYQVRACNANGCSGYATSGVVVVTLPPAGAPAINGGGTSNTGAYTISWTAVAQATTYNLLESVNGGALTPVQNSGDISWSTSGRGDGTYVYQVQACNAGGCGPWSGQVTVTVSHIPAPPFPILSQTGNIKVTVYHVTWAAVSGATRYEAIRSDTQQPAYSGTALTFTLGSTSTPKDLGYTALVRACNDVGCSAYARAN